MEVGDGFTTMFWLDRWLDGRTIQELVPELFTLIPARARKHRTGRGALLGRRWFADIQGTLGPLALWQYVQLLIRVQDFELTDGPETLLWRWMPNAYYSAKSYYDFMF
jgi:hypothetical protein